MEDHTFAADTLVEERVVVMHPPCGGNPTLRKAHFLKPLFGEDHDHFPPPPSSLCTSKPICKKVKKYNLRSYKNNPSEKWKIWVHSLRPKYEEIWKQAGVYEAILASTYKIPKDKDLIMALAERWCGETNTFVFPWGEVTITLEDVMFLGGYSVLGALYLTPIADECVDVFDSLKNAYREVMLLGGSISKKWMKYFMSSGKQLEHVAFLAMWLSRFVFTCSDNYICVKDFSVAIQLSRGNRIALAPVVLASIYKDMRVLHNSIVKSSKGLLCHIDLVNMWAWERFLLLRPTPCVVERAEPRSARWNGVEILDVKDVGLALDSGEESFMWRPYVIASSNCMLSRLYRDNEQWLVVESDDIESFARCLRVSELVGLGYTEQYLPHRVAMQFGIDQDVPPPVIRSNESPEAAWSSYNRSIRGMKLYIPPRLFESDVSFRYVVWWRGLRSVNAEKVNTCIQNETHVPLISYARKRGHMRGCSRLSNPDSLSAIPEDYIKQVNHTIAQPDNCSREYLSERTKTDGKRIDLGNIPVSNTHSGMTTPAMRICTNEHVQLSMQIMSSSDKCKESKSCSGRLISPNEDAVVSIYNDAEVNIVSIKLRRDEVVSKTNCPEKKIVDIGGESRGNTTTEQTHLELMARIMRLEKIVNDIKAAKHDAGS